MTLLNRLANPTPNPSVISNRVNRPIAPMGVSDATLSRKLSWLLRHAAASKDLNMTRDGWVELDHVLALMEFRRYTKGDIVRAVQNNDKCRFSLRAVSRADGSVVESRCPSSPSLRATQILKPGPFLSIAESNLSNDGGVCSDESSPVSVELTATPPRIISLSPTYVNVRELPEDQLLQNGIVLYIRANQGHSINIVEQHAIGQIIKSPGEVPVCLHGTFYRCWGSISKTGLRRMQRNAIHFAAGLPGDEDVLSGMRKTAEIIIYLDVAFAMQDGITFYRSENNVILSSGVDGVIQPKYFMRVVDARTNRFISNGAGQ
eukprot:Lankesteria_metandrocarpae@DN4273_c1_g1_i1.p1